MLKTGLKEWPAVIRALETGQQILLLRKGGIVEPGGSFRLEADQFALYQTFEHQRAELIRPEFRHLADEAAASRRGALVSVTCWAEVIQTVTIAADEQAYALAPYHIWTEDYVRMRLDYKPERPLHAMLLRVYKLPMAVEMVETTEMAGCRSWVELPQVIATEPSERVVAESALGEKTSELLSAMQC